MNARNRKPPEAGARLAAARGECYTPGATGPGAVEQEGAQARPFCWKGSKCPPTTTDATAASGPSRCASASRGAADHLRSLQRPDPQLLSAAPFILKGGGWYVTDYPSEGRKKGIEAEKKSSGDPTPSAAPATTGTDAAASTGSASKSGETSSDAPAPKANRSRSRPRRPPADGAPGPTRAAAARCPPARTPPPGPSCRSALRAPAGTVRRTFPRAPGHAPRRCARPAIGRPR